MKRFLIVAGLLGLLSACNQDQQADSLMSNEQSAAGAVAAEVDEAMAAPPEQAALVEDAKVTVKALAGALQSELQAAMKSGGPLEALDVCNVRAPEIAQAVSIDNGMQVHRVSVKNRNPATGTPNAWQAAVLKDFETRKTAGEDLKTMSYAEIVDEEFRFMKAIPVGGVCLKCHGSELGVELENKLEELYPEDKATRYREGDLRGSFVVVKQLTQ